MKNKSNIPTELELSGVIKKIREIGGDRVKFIILYGSAARGELTHLSDIDIAVFYNADSNERFKFRMKILGRINNRFDVHIYQDLPLYIQKEIISGGKVLYLKDYIQIFNVFMKTIREFGDFKPRLDLYYSSIGV